MPGQVLSDLAEALVQTAHEQAIKVIVLQATGQKSFCAGANFSELQAVSSLAQGQEFFNHFAQVINAMRTCPQLIIARIHGKAVGGGVGLTAAADYAVALESASIKLSELAIGLGPFVVGPAIQRKIGLAAFTQLSLSPQTWFAAQWAASHGLYQEVHSSLDSLDEALHQKVAEWGKYSKPALEELKKMLWMGTEHWDQLLTSRAAISGRLVLTPESKSAIELIISNKS